LIKCYRKLLFVSSPAYIRLANSSKDLDDLLTDGLLSLSVFLRDYFEVPLAKFVVIVVLFLTKRDCALVLFSEEGGYFGLSCVIAFFGFIRNCWDISGKNFINLKHSIVIIGQNYLLSYTVHRLFFASLLVQIFTVEINLNCELKLFLVEVSFLSFMLGK